VRLIPVGEGHRPAATDIRTRLAAAGVRADVDERDETVSKRIRDAELEKVPRIVVYGDRESDAALAVRERGAGQGMAQPRRAWPQRCGYEPASRAAPFLTSRAQSSDGWGSRGFNRVERRGSGPLA
jgi:histidyl-tRNA synthetase